MKNRKSASTDCRVEVGVVENNIRSLAAEFELHALQVSRRGLHNLAAGHSRSGEGDLLHSLMLGKMLSGDVSVALNDVDNAGWESDLAHQLGNSQRRERGNLRRLHHHAIPRRERGSHFPTGEHQRKIPRHYLSDHAERLVQHVVQKALLDGNDAALEFVGHAAEVAEGRRSAGNIERARVANRMSGVERLDPGELLGIYLDRVSQLQEQPSAISRSHITP